MGTEQLQVASAVLGTIEGKAMGEFDFVVFVSLGFDAIEFKRFCGAAMLAFVPENFAQFESFTTGPFFLTFSHGWEE